MAENEETKGLISTTKVNNYYTTYVCVTAR